MEAKAHLKYARISPRKVKIVLDLIRGKDVAQAMAILKNTPKSASEYLTKLLRSAVANAENNFFHMNFMLDYMHASYYELTEQYDRALEQYGKIISELRPSYAPYQHVQLNIQCARLLAKQGQTDKACFIYQRTSALQDSLDNLSYVRQINELRTIYQIDQLEIKNQQERNRTILWGILAVLSMLGLILLLIFLIKKGNKRLFLSKEKLEKAQQYAENSTRTKSLFLSNMSHEIRTPLNALSGFSAILTDDSIDNDTRQQCNEIIQQNSELLLKLINDVIDLSSVDVGKLTFNLKESDAVVICRNVVETVEKVKQTQAEVRFVTTLESLPLVTDDSRLQQLLINLLINATKFTTEGVITLEVEKESDTVALFSVTDTGCGMDKETMQHIFEPFFTTKKTGEGTGLGLALADQIIRTHRGRIRAESTIGRGTTFYVYLPVLEQQQEREQLQWGVDSKLRILAADDNNKVLDLLDKDLSALGLSVSTCSRRGELRQLLEQQPFDVLAIDESLMSSSGVDLCMAIRGRYPGMTRIVMTNAPTREIVDARSHGVIDGYVVKPVSASTLLAQIRSSRKE